MHDATFCYSLRLLYPNFGLPAVPFGRGERGFNLRFLSPGVLNHCLPFSDAGANSFESTFSRTFPGALLLPGGACRR